MDSENNLMTALQPVEINLSGEMTVKEAKQAMEDLSFEEASECGVSFVLNNVTSMDVYFAQFLLALGKLSMEKQFPLSGKIEANSQTVNLLRKTDLYRALQENHYNILELKNS